MTRKIKLFISKCVEKKDTHDGEINIIGNRAPKYVIVEVTEHMINNKIVDDPLDLIYYSGEEAMWKVFMSEYPGLELIYNYSVNLGIHSEYNAITKKLYTIKFQQDNENNEFSLSYCINIRGARFVD